jgi:Bacterial type III secretion protein (HrpB4)
MMNSSAVLSPAPQSAAECAALLQSLFAAAQSKSLRLAQHVHPAWVAAALPQHSAWALQGHDGPVAQRVSQLLGQLYGVRWPGLHALRWRAHRVALLPRSMVLRVLAGTALYLQRAGVRHCVGRASRLALENMVGAPAMAALLNAPTAGHCAGSTTPLDFASLDPELWAAEGYRALHAAGVWTCKDASVIARLTLAPGAFDRPTPATAATPDITPSSADLAAYLHQLEHFFPEQSWLFGSNMDRALSVLNTASSAAPTLPR